MVFIQFYKATSLKFISNNNTLKSIVRHGGSRPGKKPVFNWKQKKLLGIEKKEEKFKFLPVGDFEDIQRFYNESEGDCIIDLDKYDEFIDPTINVVNNNRKPIKMNLLFGSNKSYGFIERKHKQFYKRRFNHQDLNSVKL